MSDGADGSQIGRLITGMRAAFDRGENAMEYARKAAGAHANCPTATLIAYDLQAGAYSARDREHPEANARWCKQLAEILDPLLTVSSTLLEVGCGEATTLAGILQRLTAAPHRALGFDISWSRCAAGLEWLCSQKVTADLFVADLFAIPLQDSSVDIVFTSHALEPNGGAEERALRELIRVARRTIVLVEPIYELASDEARERMDKNGYVRNLKATLERLGARVADYRLLPYSANPLNPSGLILIQTDSTATHVAKAVGQERHPDPIEWRCPLTGTALQAMDDVYVSPETGVAFPVLRGIPLLRPEHAVVASKLVATVPQRPASEALQ